MKLRIILLLMCLTSVSVACSGHHSETIHNKFEDYGFDQAYSDAEDFVDNDSEQALKRINDQLAPDRVISYLNGYLFVYEESGRYQSGVYIDSESIDAWGGSGLEITKWNERAGWVKIKIRTPAGND